MSFFTRVVDFQVRKGWLSETEGQQLIDHLEHERSAVMQGHGLPELPHEWKGRWAFTITWAMHRVHMERPATFSWGLLCLVPAILITFYWIAVRLWNLVARLAGGL